MIFKLKMRLKKWKIGQNTEGGKPKVYPSGVIVFCMVLINLGLKKGFYIPQKKYKTLYLICTDMATFILELTVQIYNLLMYITSILEIKLYFYLMNINNLT